MEINDIQWMISNSIAAFGSGLFSSIITLGLLPYLEGTFNISTSLSLLEQANLNHPIIKRLMMTAPGTYQHSLMVASLSEMAAEAINANPILARTGAYFHDIGKLKRPSFFTENQFASENPHHALSPRMSKIVIAAHAKDGVEMAMKNKLPTILQDIMMQHHGTSVVSFFYSQALSTEDTPEPDSIKEEFRYPGPTPQFKESGIIMLADSVEAAVKSLEKPTPTKIENMIDRIFKDKIDDNQLNECPLSLKEIEIIKFTFNKVLKGIYHSRIEYPEEVASSIETKHV